MADNANHPAEEEKASTMAEVKKVYGDYEVLKPIGKGKFAVVYRAQRMTDGLVVALKRISVDQIDAKARDKCLKEVRLLQSLDHPNIIRYLDSFISENDLVIVVEWAAAGDLKRQLRKAQERGVGFEERIIWKYFAQIADAMKHMHERRVMHRDLKPANIFLTLDGTVKVGDLGLSRELSEHTVQAHSKVGTPLYMSPEVLRGDGYDFKSDVWSLGCILYELAMLKSPFKAEGLNLYGLFQKISAGDFQPIPENYSDELRSLVYSCMSAKAEDRPEISNVCTVATAQREKSAKQRASRTNSAGSSGASAGGAGVPPEGQGPVPPHSIEKSSRPSSTASPRNGADGQDAEPKDPPSRGNSGRKSARSAATPPTNARQGADGGSFLSDYKFHGSGAAGAGGDGMEDKDSAMRVPSANSVSGSGRPDSKAGSRQEQAMRLTGGGGGVQIDDDDGSGSLSARVPVQAVQPAPVVRSGFSRPDSAGRSRRSQEQQQAGAAQGRPMPEATEQRGFDGRSGSQQGKAGDRGAGGGRPASRGTDAGLNGGRRGSEPVADQWAPAAVPAPAIKKAPNRTAHNSPSYDEAPVARGGRQQQQQDNFIRTDVLPGDDSDDSREAPRSASGPKRTIRSASGAGSAAVDPAQYAQMNASAELMDLLYVKLTILGFPFRGAGGVNSWRRALTSLHFLCDLTLLGGRDNLDSSQQFRRFVQVVVWLCTELGHESMLARWDVDADSPMLLAKQVLLVSQAAGVSSSVLSADRIPPSSLLPGYGEKVCVLLSALADCLLARRNYKFRALVPAESDAVADAAEMEVSPEDEENVLEELDAEAGEDIEDGGGGEPLGQSAGAAHSHAAGQSMIFTAADPVMWREETERVGRSLRVAVNTDGTWLSHFEVLKDFANKNGTVVSAERSSISSSGNIAELRSFAQQLDKELSAQAERIGRFESSISLSTPLAALGAAFGTVKQELTALETQLAAGTKSLDQKGGRLAELEAEFDDVNDKYQEKHGDVSGNQGDSSGPGAGGNVLVRVKSAIRQIKGEIQHLALREGVCSNALLALRVAQQNAKRAERESYYRKKRGGKKGAGAEAEHDE